MAQNLATKYAKQVDERFKLKELTAGGVNRNFDWVGTNAINIYSIATSAMNNYTSSGTSRYGTAAELDNTLQTLTLTRDRSFTFSIDRKNYDDTMMIMNAGKALARQLDEVVIPETDIYRIAAMSAGAIANGGTATLALTTSNAYTAFLDGQEFMDDRKVPVNQRVAFCTPGFISLIKENSSFMKSTEIAQKMLVNGQVGEIDGIKIIKVPTSYLPANHAFIIAHPDATVVASKLEDYKIHDNPPGINGFLVDSAA